MPSTVENLHCITLVCAKQSWGEECAGCPGSGELHMQLTVHVKLQAHIQT